MKTANELKQLLYSIDRKGYPAYKGIKGSYRFEKYVLYIDHVQGDPFAAPSNRGAKENSRFPGKTV